MLTSSLIFVLSLMGPPTENGRSVRFIGNSGFEISDGSSVILVDFPYESGAYGYMTFQASELRERPASLCLFTHAHADHLSPADLSRIGCRVAGPSAVLARTTSVPRLKGDSPWSFGGASIHCIPSEHGEVEHCSYRLEWHDTVILIAGDVESVGPLLGRADRLDLLLLPHWLSEEASEIRRRFPDARILLSHHEPGRDIAICSGCRRLEQGESTGW